MKYIIMDENTNGYAMCDDSNYQEELESFLQCTDITDVRVAKVLSISKVAFSLVDTEFPDVGVVGETVSSAIVDGKFDTAVKLEYGTNIGELK